MKFKKGDKVRLVRRDLSPHEYFDHPTNEMTVKGVEDSGNLRVHEKEEGVHQTVNSACLIPSNAVIHTKTQGEYDRLMEELEKVGYEWCDGDKPTEYNDWFDERGETVIEVCDGIRSGNRKEEERKARPIISFTDIFGEVEETDPDYREFVEEPGGYFVDEAINLPGRWWDNDGSVKVTLQEWKEAIKKHEELTNEKPMFNKLTNALKRMLNKDEQKLYKVGYINGGLELSNEGRVSYVTNLYLEGGDHEKAKANMVAEAEEQLEEEKE